MYTHTMKRCLAASLLVVYVWCAVLLPLSAVAVSTYAYDGCYSNRYNFAGAGWKIYFGKTVSPPSFQEVYGRVECEALAVAQRKRYYAYAEENWGEDFECMLLNAPLRAPNRPEFFNCATGPDERSFAGKATAARICECPNTHGDLAGRNGGETLALYKVAQPYPPLTTTAAAVPSSSPSPPSPSPSPTTPETTKKTTQKPVTDAPTSCADLAGWADTDGYTCQAYASCKNGGWQDKGDAYYGQWAVNGVSARKACCDCGRGSSSGSGSTQKPTEDPIGYISFAYTLLGNGYCADESGFHPRSCHLFSQGKVPIANCRTTCDSFQACTAYQIVVSGNYAGRCNIFGAGLPAAGSVGEGWTCERGSGPSPSSTITKVRVGTHSSAVTECHSKDGASTAPSATSSNIPTLQPTSGTTAAELSTTNKGTTARMNTLATTLATTAAAAPTTTAPTLDDPTGYIERVNATDIQYKGLISPTRQFLIWGWACQKGRGQVINVTVTVGGTPVQEVIQGNGNGTVYGNIATEADIQHICGDSLNHRFVLGIVLHEGQRGALVVRAGITSLTHSGNFTVGTPCSEGMRNSAGPCNITTKTCPCADNASFAYVGMGYCLSIEGRQLPRYFAYRLTAATCSLKCAAVSGCQGYAYAQSNRQFCLAYGHNFSAGSLLAGFDGHSEGNGGTASTRITQADGSKGVECYTTYLPTTGVLATAASTPEQSATNAPVTSSSASADASWEEAAAMRPANSDGKGPPGGGAQRALPTNVSSAGETRSSATTPPAQ